MPHKVSQAQNAMTEALPAIKGAFTVAGLTVKGVVVNVLYEEGDVLWAVGSAPPSGLSIEEAEMLAGSLRVSAEELAEA